MTHFSYTALLAMPMKQRPWRMGTLKPPILAKPGSTCKGLFRVCQRIFHPSTTS